MARVSAKQLERLRPYLIGEQPREDGEWDMFCPMHEDRKRSAQLNVKLGKWFCFAEERGGSVEQLLDYEDEFVDPPSSAMRANSGRKSKRPAGQPAEEINDGKVDGWHASLMSNEPALEDLVTARGLWTSTLAEFKIGWDRAKNAYTIPVLDDKGAWKNIRRYQIRPPAGRRKMWGIEGANEPCIFPYQVINTNPDEIIICEGELDALITNQYGFPAVTRTASARTWRAEWNHLFKDKVVYLAHDADDAGQDANRRVGRALLKVAREVRTVRLPYPITDKHGRDLTDWWLDHDGDDAGFRRLLEESAPFDASQAEEAEETDPADANVMDALDGRKAGRPLRLTVTIKGKRDPGYTVPRKTRYRCTRDNGETCKVCPLYGAGGDDEKITPSGDEVILEMMESTRPQLQQLLRAQYGIPKCPKLTMDVTEHQSVEVLFARPSVDHMNGNGAGDYKSIKLTSVGRHDTMPNNTVRVVGALRPDPRKQLSEFQVWDIARMETTLDRFNLDSDTIKELKQFRPAKGQRPLKRMREIADDLASHVTHIYGRPEMHALMDLTFHSALSFDFNGKRMHRGWIDSLILGDTRTGKSEAATRLSRFYRAGEIISCEAASFAGIVGGLQQFGGKEWAITWGAVPLNDRRLVVLDEISGLSPEEIGAMSSVRSSGVAELTKIAQERTYARTRLLWIGNPRDARMHDYTYGVQAIRPLIGNAEDIARFDLAMTVAAGEVDPVEINRAYQDTPQRFSQQACASLVRWVWSRTADQVAWAPGAEAAVFKSALDLGARYVEDPPLIQAANVREKIARVAVALAARLFSTDDSYERIVVTRDHVRDAVAFIDRLYKMPGFGYADRSAERIADQKQAAKNAGKVKIFLYNHPGLGKFLRSQGKFRRQDLEEILNVDREQANAIINTLYEMRMVYKEKGDVRVEPTLHTILRGVKE